MIWIFLMPLFAFAQKPPVHWSSALKITERHEFYQNNEVLSKPKGAWQTLFAIVYPDASLNLFKDCVFYKVPGDGPGILKIKSMDVSDSCENYQEKSGNTEIQNLKALQFSLGDSEIILNFTLPDFRNTRWRIPLVNDFTKSSPRMLMSSAEFKAPKLILLATKKEITSTSHVPKKEDKSLCHDVREDCQEVSPSTCGQCPNGWYEAPNGCPQGPKFCGVMECGLKNAPACRRGMRFQRERKKFSCRVDSSFAFCAPGLSIQCLGDQAWCR